MMDCRRRDCPGHGGHVRRIGDEWVCCICSGRWPVEELRPAVVTRPTVRVRRATERLFVEPPPVEAVKAPAREDKPGKAATFRDVGKRGKAKAGGSRQGKSPKVTG